MNPTEASLFHSTTSLLAPFVCLSVFFFFFVPAAAEEIKKKKLARQPGYQTHRRQHRCWKRCNAEGQRSVCLACSRPADREVEGGGGRLRGESVSRYEHVSRPERKKREAGCDSVHFSASQPIMNQV